jgi:hypothetical protein
MGLHVDGAMWTTYRYGYELKKYKNCITEDILKRYGFHGEDVVEDDDMLYYVTSHGGLFVCYVLGYFDNMANNSMINIDANSSEFKEKEGIVRFEEAIQRLAKELNIDDVGNAMIMCEVKQDCEEDDEEFDDFDPCYVHMNYGVMYGIKIDNDICISEKASNQLMDDILWKFEENLVGCLYDYSIVGGIVDIHKVGDGIKVYDDMDKLRMSMVDNEQYKIIISKVEKLHEEVGKKMPELELIAVKYMVDE